MKISDLKTKKFTQKQAFAIFDSLPTIDKKAICGKWKGYEIITGHPMEGLLTASNWHGKEFINFETVHPLVFDKFSGGQFYGNPALMPIMLPIHRIPKWLVTLIMKCFWRVLKTNKSRARLYNAEYREKVSAAMVYDQLPIIDNFRKIDENTLMGAMDIKGYFSRKTYFFLLERE